MVERGERERERERQKWRNREIKQDTKIRTHASPNSGSQYLFRDLLSSLSVHSMHTCVMQMLHTCAHAGGQAYRHGDTQARRRTCIRAWVHTHITSNSIKSSRHFSRLQRRTYGRCSEPCFMGAERKVGGKLHPRQLWRKDVAQFCNGIELAQFCLMRSAHAACIHVCVCDVA